jgi:hypothetical protein
VPGQGAGIREFLGGGAPVDLERPDQPPVDVVEERISHIVPFSCRFPPHMVTA